MGYLTVAQFKTRSTMPPQYIDEIEEVSPGFTLAQINAVSALDIDARLRKRYAAPFAEPYPEAVMSWCARIVTVQCWKRRGYDPTDQSMQDVIKDRDEAKAEIKEAADSVEGLFDLPLRSDTNATGISKGAPSGYSEQSPYVWADAQVDTARDEDLNRRGT
jgi:hypothetical protein